MFPRNTNKANGIPSGVRKKLMNSMFTVTGKMRIFAKVTQRPVTNDNPQSNSTDFAKGIK